MAEPWELLVVVQNNKLFLMCFREGEKTYSSCYKVTWWKSSYSSGSRPAFCSTACCIRGIQGFMFWGFGKALQILPMIKGVSNSWSRPWDAHNQEEPIVHHRWVLLSLVPTSPMPSGRDMLTHLPAPTVLKCQAPTALPPSSPCATAAVACWELQQQGPSSVQREEKSQCLHKKQLSLLGKNQNKTQKPLNYVHLDVYC